LMGGAGGQMSGFESLPLGFNLAVFPFLGTER